MNGIFDFIQSDKSIYFGFLFGALCTFGMVAAATLFYGKLPPYIPLFHQMPWGEARLGTRSELFLPIGIVGAVFLGNLFLAHFLHRHIPLVSRILSLTGSLIAFLGLLFIIRTLLLIT